MHGDGARVRYSLGSYVIVNTPFLSTHEGIQAPSRPCTRALRWTQGPCVLTVFISSRAIHCFVHHAKLKFYKRRLMRRTWVTLYAVSYRVLAQGVNPTQHHFVPVPRHWFPGLTPSVDSPLGASYCWNRGNPAPAEWASLRSLSNDDGDGNGNENSKKAKGP